jgi:Family of unknown function (DUF6338)
MSLPSNEVLAVLTYLLPGFVAAWVFFGLTAFEKPPPFERVVQALIFTVLIQPALIAEEAGLVWAGAHVGAIGAWSEQARVTWSVASAIAIGFFGAWAANKDTVHKALRARQITNQTSLPSEWFTSFAANPGSWVVLHLSDGRRLFGSPDQWPSSRQRGHFALRQAEWLVGTVSMPLTGVEVMLVPVEEVGLVEIMSLAKERKNGN